MKFKVPDKRYKKIGGYNMDIKTQLKTVDWIGKLMIGNIDRLNVNKYSPQKPIFEKSENESNLDSNAFDVVVPEKVGIRSEYIEQFLVELSKNRDIDVHEVMILKDGKIIVNTAFAPYRTSIKHISHSMCKSIISLALGCLIDDGKIDLQEKIVDILKQSTNVFNSARMRSITVENLLTMSTGVNFNEAGSIVENDWLAAYFDSAVTFEPGTKFAYNSMNTYVLGRIIEVKTGKDLFDYIQERLLNPLEIYDWYWERCPQQHLKAGWGLSFKIEDMAKIGQMCLDKGVWKGKRIISEAWIEELAKKKIDTLKEQNEYGYSYYTWIGKSEGSYIFNGMLGQNMVIIPKNNMVVITTAGSPRLFPNSEIMCCIEKYFMDRQKFVESGLTDNPMQYRRLCNVMDNLEFNCDYNEIRTRQIYHGGWKRKGHERIRKSGIDRKKEYEFISNRYSLKSNNVGIMPLFIQCLHNNYENGINEMAFEMQEDILIMKVSTSKEVHEIPLGINRYVYSQYVLNEEIYEIASKCNIVDAYMGIIVMDIKIVFVETTNTRTIRCVFRNDSVKLEFNELPEIGKIIDGVSDMMNIPIRDINVNPLTALNEIEFTKYKIENVLNPKIQASVVE